MKMKAIKICRTLLQGSQCEMHSFKCLHLKRRKKLLNSIISASAFKKKEIPEEEHINLN